MAIVCPRRALPLPRDLKQGCLGKIVADKLNRKRQTTRRKAAHHSERGVASDIERRASLPWVGALDLFGIIDTAWRVHCAGAEQDVDFAQRGFDSTDHLQASAPRLNIVSCAQESPSHQAAPGELTIILGFLTQPLAVNCPSLALKDHPVDSGELAECRQADVADPGPELLQRAGNVLQRGHHLGISRHVFLVEMTDEANAKPVYAALELSIVVAGRRSDTAGIERIMTGE